MICVSEAIDVIGIDKAGAPMATAIEVFLGDHLRDYQVIAKYGQGACQASHSA
jgi:orotate phosphoribosyltransferase-like protein